MIMVTHEPDFAIRSSRQIHLVDGKVDSDRKFPRAKYPADLQLIRHVCASYSRGLKKSIINSIKMKHFYFEGDTYAEENHLDCVGESS